jgi:hypothetical protein
MNLGYIKTNVLPLVLLSYEVKWYHVGSIFALFMWLLFGTLPCTEYLSIQSISVNFKLIFH